MCVCVCVCGSVTHWTLLNEHCHPLSPFSVNDDESGQDVMSFIMMMMVMVVVLLMVMVVVVSSQVWSPLPIP